MAISNFGRTPLRLKRSCILLHLYGSSDYWLLSATCRWAQAGSVCSLLFIFEQMTSSPATYLTLLGKHWGDTSGKENALERADAGITVNRSGKKAQKCSCRQQCHCLSTWLDSLYFRWASLLPFMKSVVIVRSWFLFNSITELQWHSESKLTAPMVFSL